MNPLKNLLLNAYYMATLPVRRYAAADRAARQCEPICVLFYHRVADQHPNGWTISTSGFKRQIDWLRHRCDLISLAEMQERVASGKNERPSACITFDDGYGDNMQFAVPYLLQHHVPFTYFVSTNHALHGEPFPHDVAAGLPLRPNTIEELRQLAAAGVEIGGHTRGHCDLGQSMPAHRLVSEIRGCKEDLEQAIDVVVRYFAFPYGLPGNMSGDAFRIAHEAGYRGVCSAYGDYNFPGGDPFHLRRIHADPEMIRFRNWLTIDPRKLHKSPYFDPGDYCGRHCETAGVNA
jgi:peptidoglycan/xylan/chitin deacetylase (PgdA/CDA1 family)